MMKLSIGYPEAEEELRLARNFLAGKTVEEIKGVCTADDVRRMKKDVLKVSLSDGVIKYVRDVISLTRQEKSFVLGASPRAMLSLIRASQARAYLAGREYVKPDDVKAVAIPVLHHRLNLTPEAKIRKEVTDRLLKELILKAKVPME